jgi:hypothetical protein
MAEDDRVVETGSGGSSPPNRRAIVLIIAAWLALVAFDLWLLLIRPDAPWATRIGYVLGLLGVYTFAFGLLAETELLKKLPYMGDELTSPNPILFLAANMTALSLLSMAGAIAIDPLRTASSLDRRGGIALSFVEGLLMLVGFVLIVASTIVYIVVIAPLAWLAYTVASAPLDSIISSGRDMEFVVQRDGEEVAIRMKALVADHLVTLRNLLVAVPSLVSSLILDAPGLF